MVSCNSTHWQICVSVKSRNVDAPDLFAPLPSLITSSRLPLPDMFPVENGFYLHSRNKTIISRIHKLDEFKEPFKFHVQTLLGQIQDTEEVLMQACLSPLLWSSRLLLIPALGDFRRLLPP